jgi:hypothetical protein
MMIDHLAGTACHLFGIESGISISPDRFSRNVGAIYEE